jgi:hypothetical protein
MPYGNFYFGPNGFLYKKNGAIGNRHNPSLGLICNRPQDTNNKYVYGSGVGAKNPSIRRRLKRHATICNGQTGKCNFDYFYLNSIPLGN